MREFLLPFLSILFASSASIVSAYTPNSIRPTRTSTRKAFLQTLTTSTIAATTFLSTPPTPLFPLAPPPLVLVSPANAFDGSGSSAFAGKSTTSKSDLRKSYQKRIIADVRDFKKLGVAIESGKVGDDNGGDAWVNFFIPFKRREPDDVGRTYAALVDLVGNKELSGCGILLAASYAKAGKPSEGLPSVKKYNAMAKTFGVIETSGNKGDVEKTKLAWGKAKDALSDYLGSVDLPSDLEDPIYD